MKARPLTLYTCSPCNLTCQECIMQHHMDLAPKYHMSLEDVANLCQLAEKCEYRFDIILSGGEPLLWKYLNEALYILGNAPAIRTVTMFTNGILHNRLTKKAAWHCNAIRLSDYGHNAGPIIEMQKLYPTRASIVDRTGFWRNPRYAYPKEEAHPVQCLNPEIMLYDGRVYACPHCLSIAQVLTTPPTADALSVPLAAGFLDAMDALKQTYHNDICTRCVSNKRIRDNIGIQDVNVSGTKGPELQQLGDLRPASSDRWKTAKD